MSRSDENGPDEVGYKKPPRSSQWKPGQSGNPKGRPKKIKDLDKLFDLELSQTVRISDGGETKVLSKRELIIKRLINEAVNGDKAALKLALSFMKTHLSVEGFEPDPNDRAALISLLESAKLDDERDGTTMDSEDSNG